MTRHAEPTFLETLWSFAGVAGLAVLVPFAILVVGLPVVLAIRALLEVIGWLAGLGAR
jgi:hypothetical protein